MTNGIQRQTNALGECLSRIEVLIAALDGIDDTDCRSISRDLMDAILSLHGIALAKAIAICQSGDISGFLMRKLLDDEYFAAVTLLHGLHPEDAEVRLRRKVSELRAHLGVRGVRVDLIGVDRTTARVRVSISGEQTHEIYAGLIAEVERALTEAAPDIDRIIVEDFNPYSSQVENTSTPVRSSAAGVNGHGRQSA